MKKERILVLDGLRGLAILLVFLFHGYYVWDIFYPYKKMFSENIVFKYGSLGVQLFFLISGFVILMSVEKTSGFVKFIKNRWLRLFPSMLICSVFIYLTAGFFHERPFGIPELKSLLPGVLFINNGVLEKIVGTNFPVLELSFWSLYVEVKFYIIFGALFFAFNRRVALIGIFLLYISALVLQILCFHELLFENTWIKMYVGTFIHFGWFVVGALTYIYYYHRDRKYLFIILFVWMCSLCYGYKFQDLMLLIYLIALNLIFFGALFWKRLNLLFSNRFFQFIGFISYPLYLLHENMLISLIIKIHNQYPEIPPLLLPVFSFVFIGFLAYIIAKYLEPFLVKIAVKL
ncbi:acyltransferase family protein [Chryseobacterium turcicum]|uniref:Acyltransferase n=1 Tax=Chryseobacterium turcicum TaxID=2898076 RepID=A0A9Q3YUB8_9FLAO|nr:acyltransferase [Chryseobacterium turcicum]MCD1115784.1 acyltransferase [Chryseobacterium turcicum]